MIDRQRKGVVSLAGQDDVDTIRRAQLGDEVGGQIGGGEIGGRILQGDGVAGVEDHGPEGLRLRQVEGDRLIRRLRIDLVDACGIESGDLRRSKRRNGRSRANHTHILARAEGHACGDGGDLGHRQIEHHIRGVDLVDPMGAEALEGAERHGLDGVGAVGQGDSVAAGDGDVMIARDGAVAKRRDLGGRELDDGIGIGRVDLVEAGRVEQRNAICGQAGDGRAGVDDPHILGGAEGDARGQDIDLSHGEIERGIGGGTHIEDVDAIGGEGADLPCCQTLQIGGRIRERDHIGRGQLHAGGDQFPVLIDRQRKGVVCLAGQDDVDAICRAQLGDEVGGQIGGGEIGRRVLQGDGVAGVEDHGAQLLGHRQVDGDRLIGLHADAGRLRIDLVDASISEGGDLRCGQARNGCCSINHAHVFGRAEGHTRRDGGSLHQRQIEHGVGGVEMVDEIGLERLNLGDRETLQVPRRIRQGHIVPIGELRVFDELPILIDREGQPVIAVGDRDGVDEFAVEAGEEGNRLGLPVQRRIRERHRVAIGQLDGPQGVIAGDVEGQLAIAGHVDEINELTRALGDAVFAESGDMVARIG